MSEVGVTHGGTLTAAQLLNSIETSGSSASVQKDAEQLIAAFGADNVSGAYQNMTQDKFVAGLKSMIDSNPSLSEPAKEMAYARIDSSAADLRVKTTHAASEAVGASKLDNSSSSDMQALMSMLESIMMGIAAKNDEESGAGSTEGKKNSKNPEGGGGNWLEKLAEGLAAVQAKWLEKADAHLAAMDEAAGMEDDAKNEEGQSGTQAFTMAQSKYSAAMQMFSMTAAATSTSIKSVGEGLAGIARKQ